MIHLPTLFKGTLAAAIAAMLCASTAKADSAYATNITAQLQALFPGKSLSITTASAAQIEAATWAAIAADQANAGEYVHEVLFQRLDRNKIAAVLTSKALAPANADPALSGSIAARATAQDLQNLSVSPLTPATLASVTEAMILIVPKTENASFALSVGNAVAANITDTLTATKTTFATTVVSKISKAGNGAIGAFVGGVSLQVPDWTGFAKILIAKAPKAEADISYSAISADGANRIALSGSFTGTIAAGLKVADKALVAQGVIAASGTANTAIVINKVLGLDQGVKGQQILFSNLDAFAGAVAGASAKSIANGGSVADATDVMSLITSTIVTGTYASALNLAPTVTLNELDKTKLGAAIVKVAPLSLSDGDHLTKAPNPANAAVTAIITSGGITNPYAFAITVAKGASNYDNAGQVANAVASSSLLAPTEANYLALSGSMIKALPKAAAAISERVAQLIAPSTNQADRISYATQLAQQFPSSAQLIAVGVANTDYGYSGIIVSSIVNVNNTSIRNNAAKIAGAVASTMPGEEACNISLELGKLIASGTLKYSQASAIVSAIANAPSVKNEVNGNEELQVVAAQMAGQLLTHFDASSSIDTVQAALNKTITDSLTAMAKSVASIAYKAYKVKISPSNDEQLTGFANQVAGSVAQMILNILPTDSLARQDLFAKLAKALIAVTPNAAGDLAIQNAIANAISGATHYDTACLTSPETPVTNF